MPKSNPQACPLCRSPDIRAFAAVKDPDLTREYYRCESCQLTFLDPAQQLSPEAEKAHYDCHENNPEDAGYRRFLGRLFHPLSERIELPSDVLDYGCGPGPALAHMIREQGHHCWIYDPNYFPDTSPLNWAYDAITLTEVAEHFHNPGREFQWLQTLVKPGGLLAIMTCFQNDDDRFARWHYRADPTHVSFYRQETFKILAADIGWEFESPAKDIVFLRRPAGEPAGLGRVRN